jgi:hypothetical protein
MIIRGMNFFDHLAEFEFGSKQGMNQGNRWVLLMKNPEVKYFMQVGL